MDSDLNIRIKALPIEIERLRAETGLNYIDCTVEACTRFGIELESVKGILPKVIKEKIQRDALELNLLKIKVGTVTE